MRLMFVLAMMVVLTSLKAQAIFPGWQGNVYSSSLYRDHHLYDSANKQRWFISRSFGISAGYSFFKGGNAAIVSAPLSLQLNRKLTNNLYAFAGVSAAPAYISFNNAFLNTDLNKLNRSNRFIRQGAGVYTNASLGLMYVNDARTFSISGSIGIERNSYPFYNYQPPNAGKPNNNAPAYR